MDIDTLMSKHSRNYRFHGARAATLSRLVAQSENGSITLWGRDLENEGEYLEGHGELSCTDISDIEMSYNEFCDDGGLVLVLEKIIENPFEEGHESDVREHLIRAEEWRVIGGLHPIFDEDGDVIDQEAFSLEEIMQESY